MTTTANPNLIAVLNGYVQLHALYLADNDQGDEADAVRDSMDAPWYALSEADHKRLDGLSARLYEINHPVTVDDLLAMLPNE